MHIEIFALCDAATDQMGKLNLLGTFDRIFAAQMPAAHPQCAIAVRIRFSRIEKGEHRIRFSVIDEDGKAVVPTFDATIPVDFPAQIASQAYNMVFNIQGLKMEKYGEYSLDLAVDGRQEASLPLMVCEPPQRPDQPPAP
jgi:hypothetical protein